MFLFVLKLRLKNNFSKDDRLFAQVNKVQIDRYKKRQLVTNNKILFNTEELQEMQGV